MHLALFLLISYYIMMYTCWYVCVYLWASFFLCKVPPPLPPLPPRRRVQPTVCTDVFMRYELCEMQIFAVM